MSRGDLFSPEMSLLAVALLASLALAAAVVAAGRRRRAARRETLAPIRAPRPPGVSHLAARVSELSDHGLHLHASRHAADKRRLGVLLGLR